MSITCEDWVDRALLNKIEDEPKGQKERVTGPLADEARVSGIVGLFKMPDDRVYARYGKAYGDAKIMYANADEAKQAMTVMRKQLGDRLRGLAMAKRAGDTRQFPRTPAPVTFSDLDPSNPYRLQDLATRGGEAAPLDDAGAYLTNKIWNKIPELGIPSDVLESSGPAGRQFVRMMKQVDSLDQKASMDYILKAERAIDLIPEEMRGSGHRQMVEGKEAGTPEAWQGYRMLKDMADETYRTGQALGLKVAKLRDDYWPWVHAQRPLTDPEYRESVLSRMVEGGMSREAAETTLDKSALGTTRGVALENLMRKSAERGYAMTQEEAEHIIERNTDANSVFISGHLERELNSSIPPVEDVRTAWSVKFMRDARRLAQAQVWGPYYEKAYQAIEAIRQEDPTGRMADFANKIFDIHVGRVKEKGPDWLNSVMKWEGAKLSFSVFHMATHAPINVPIRVGIQNTLGGLMDMVKDGGWAKTLLGKDAEAQREHLREAGHFVLGMNDRFQQYGFQALYRPEEAQTTMGKVLQKTGQGILDVTGRLVDWVTEANRNIAQYAGERYFDQQVDRLIADPTDALALRRLREFYPDQRAIDTILDMAKNGNDGTLNEMRMIMGKRLVDQTLFPPESAGALDRPLFFTSAAGRMLYQFKNYVVQQTGFMARELTAYKNDGDPARTIRALTIGLTVAPAVAAAATKGREWLMGGTVTNEMLDKAFNDPTFVNLATAGLSTALTMGTMGLMADLVTTGLEGNSHVLKSFLTPPLLSSAFNLVDAGTSAARAAWNLGDSKDLARSIRALGRELGGLGGLAANQLVGPPQLPGVSR